MDKTTAGMNSRPTLKDIARTAGVSISTVSIVLSGKASERRISAQVAVRGPLFYAKIRAVSGADTAGTGPERRSL